MSQNSNQPEIFSIMSPEGHSGVLEKPVRAIRSRGNIPLMLQERIMIEFSREELNATWKIAENLSEADVDAGLKAAAANISEALEESELETEQEIAEDIASFFVLALRKQHAKFQQAHIPCRISYCHDSETAIRISALK